MPIEKTYPPKSMGPYCRPISYVHTHDGSPLNTVLKKKDIAIVNWRLVKNMNPAGHFNKQDLLPDGTNYGIDYSIEVISPKDLATLGSYLLIYIKTALEQSQLLIKEVLIPEVRKIKAKRLFKYS